MSSKDKPGSFCLSPSEIEKTLLAAGVNPTAQRIAICRYVLCEAEHPSAEGVKSWADKNFPKMSLATVYNTLRTLIDAGLLQEFRFSHIDTSVYDCNVSKHFHFLDAATGALTDISPEQVDINVRLSKEYNILDYDLVIKGKKS